MPWEETDDYIRSGHRSTDDFQEGSFRTITIDSDKGIKAVIGKPKGQDTTEVQSYLFAKDKGCTMEKAKAWLEEHKSECLIRHDLSFNLQFLTEKADPKAKIFPWSMPAQYYLKPGRLVIYGSALSAGKTRKGDSFSCEELRRGARSLIGGPIELFEHTWDVGESRWLPYPDNVVLDAEEVDGNIEYVAGVNDAKAQDLIRKGEINQVSVNAICRHVPADDPGQCNGMILNGFCLLHKDSIAASPGTSVKVWNCCRRCAGQLKSSGPKPGLSESGESKLNKKIEEMSVDEIKARIAELAGQREDLQNKLWPSPPQLPEEEQKALRIQLETIGAEIEALEVALGQKMAQNNASSPPASSAIAGPGPAAPATPTAATAQKTAAEWDTEYINDLPDSAFAVIGSGGEKDDQGKTVPRTLRHLPHHKADGSLDLPHLRNALARMNQIEPASLQSEAKSHLCAHAKESEIVSEFCGEQQKEKTEQAPCGCSSKPQTVVAAVIPVANLPKPEINVKVEEIEAIIQDRRLFTAALKLRGILDLCESRRAEAND